MSALMIKADHVSKHYRLGKLGSGRLRDDIANWIKRRPSASNEINEHSRQEIWALRDVSFEVERGEVIGFIGNNGAGKSTLIRLISGAEPPTVGTIDRNMSVSWPLAFSGGVHGALTGL